MDRLQYCEKKLRGFASNNALALKGVSNVLLACTDCRVGSIAYSIWEETGCHAVVNTSNRKSFTYSYGNKVFWQSKTSAIDMIIVLEASEKDNCSLLDLNTLGEDLSLHSVVISFEVLWQSLEMELGDAVADTGKLITKMPLLYLSCYTFYKTLPESVL